MKKKLTPVLFSQLPEELREHIISIEQGYSVGKYNLHNKAELNESLIPDGIIYSLLISGNDVFIRFWKLPE